VHDRANLADGFGELPERLHRDLGVAGRMVREVEAPRALVADLPDFDSSSVAAAVVSTLSVVVIEACAADFIRVDTSSAARRIAPEPTLSACETSLTPATTSLMVSSKALIAESSTWRRASEALMAASWCSVIEVATSKPIAWATSLAPAMARLAEKRAFRASASITARSTMLPAIMRVRGVMPILYSCSLNERLDSLLTSPNWPLSRSEA